MNFDQLFYAEVLMHQKSLQKAAAILHISKSGLSLSISQLENELGAKIFNRTSKGTFVTEAGQQMLNSISSILRSKDELENIAQLTSGTKKSHLIRIHYMNTMLKPFMTSFIENYRKNEKRNISLHISCHELSTIIQNVRDHNIDMGFIALNNAEYDLIQGLKFTPICQSKLVLVCSPENNLCDKKGKIELTDLKSQKFSLFNDQFHEHIFNSLQVMCGHLDMVLKVDDSWAMKEAITKLNTVSFGRKLQGKLSSYQELEDLPTIEIDSLIDDNFMLGWLTNPNYEMPNDTSSLLSTITEKIKNQI